MGTNFYLDKEETVHVGKRSAAGDYCWDCGVTLCTGGELNVHRGHIDWHDKCPQCGKSKKKEDLDNSTTGRELGFNKTKPKKKSGVASCSSFNWAIGPDKVLWDTKLKHIWDDYGRKYSLKEFKEILEECPIRFYDSIGQSFS